MLIIETIVVSLISAGGLAVFSKVGMVAGINFYNYYRKKSDKKKLKKLLKQSLTNNNFKDFQNVIYRIKSYDSTHNKYLYVKMKNKHFFTDKCIEDSYYFNKRFNIENDISSPTILRRMISQEIEKSLNENNLNL